MPNLIPTLGLTFNTNFLEYNHLTPLLPFISLRQVRSGRLTIKCFFRCKSTLQSRDCDKNKLWVGMNPTKKYKVRVLSNLGSNSSVFFPGPSSDKIPEKSNWGKVYLAHSISGYSPCGGKSWLQGLKAAGHIASAGKTQTMAGVQLLPSFLFSLGARHIERCSPHSRWVSLWNPWKHLHWHTQGCVFMVILSPSSLSG